MKPATTQTAPLVRIFDTMRGGKSPTKPQLGHFLKNEANYKDPLLYGAVATIIGAMRPQDRYTASLMVSRFQPRDIGPLAWPWILALEHATGLPVSSRKPAYDHIARYAPTGSDVAINAAKLSAGGVLPRNEGRMDMAAFLSRLPETIAGTRRPTLVRA